MHVHGPCHIVTNIKPPFKNMLTELDYGSLMCSSMLLLWLEVKGFLFLNNITCLVQRKG